MKKKKRRSSKTQPLSLPPTTTLQPPMVEFPSQTILLKGWDAIKALQQGNYVTALLMVQESVSNHKESPHLNSLEALIHILFAEKLAKNFDLKLMYLDLAVASAELATKKLPNSLYFALLLVDILYERALLTQEGWDLVIRQCRYALSIENSTDPGVDRFLEEDEMRNSSKESRIEDAKKQIKRYLHACQHQIKVDAAEMELKMKRMKAAAGDWIVKKHCAINFSGMTDMVKTEEAKKCMELLSSSLSSQKKKEFPTANLQDLEKHVNSLEADDLALDLSEAISSAKEYKAWKYWECFCGNQFGDCNMYRNHFRQSHGSTLELLKEEIGVCNEWISNYLKGVWKPVDTDMASHFILKQLKSEFDIACDNEHAVSGDLVENPGIGTFLDCFVSDDLVIDMKERVVFNERFSALLVDIDSLGRDLNATDIDTIAVNASAAPFPLNVGHDVESPDGDNFQSWLYEGLIWEDLEAWTCLRDSRRKMTKEVHQIFEEMCSHLKKKCKTEEIVNMQLKIKAIQVVDKYIEEIEKRENDRDSVLDHCIYFLSKRQEDLKVTDNIDSKIEYNVISDVLKEAGEAVGKRIELLLRLDPASLRDKIRKHKEFLERTDYYIRLGLQSVREKFVLKNAIVLRCAGLIQQYEKILEKISASDYRLLIVPLLKSLFRTRLLFGKDDLDVLSKDIAIKGFDGKGKKQNTNKSKTKEVKEEKVIFRKPEGTNSGEDGVLHHRDGEDDDPEVEASVNKSITTYESLPEERSEDHRKSESEPALVVNVLGVGLKNEASDCFLNVIIQSLWHLIEFRVELMSSSIPGHDHIDQNACIFCALKEVFSAIKEAYADKQGEAVDPTYFRNALIAHTGSFKKGEKHDALDCMEVILESLHDSFISVLRSKDQKKQGEAFDRTYFRNALIAHTDKFNLNGEKHLEKDNCFTADCFVHKIFGWDHHERINCVDCNMESGHRKSTSLSFTLNAASLRMMKDTHRNSSFDELLKLVNMDEKWTCDYCREKKHIYRTLRYLPHVFTVVLGWANYVESSEDISRTLSTLSTELNLNVIFQGYQPGSEYFLVSMICFHGEGKHYICFIYNQKLGKYVMYDDTSVEVTGSWNDVVVTSEKRRLQPSILFFHQKSRMKFDATRDV